MKRDYRGNRGALHSSIFSNFSIYSGFGRGYHVRYTYNYGYDL